MSAVSRLSIEDYDEIRKIICPMCRRGIPDSMLSRLDGPVFQHSDQELGIDRATCVANTFRVRRYDPTDRRPGRLKRFLRRVVS